MPPERALIADGRREVLPGIEHHLNHNADQRSICVDWQGDSTRSDITGSSDYDAQWHVTEAALQKRLGH
jgi:hypothetical protein